MHMLKKIIGLGFLTIAIFLPTGLAAKSAEIPLANAGCLVENQSKYLNQTKSLVIFYPEFCPAVSDRELSIKKFDPDTALRLVMRKGEFECMIHDIGEYLNTNPEPVVGRERKLFGMEC